MKILYITTLSPFYNSPASIRNIGLIEGLIENNNRVDILTIQENINALAFDNTLNFSNNITVYKIPINLLYNAFTYKKKNNKKSFKLSNKIKSFIKKIYSRIEIYDGLRKSISTFKKLGIDYSQYDVFISSSDPKSSHLLAKKIIMKNSLKGLRWIQYWGDPFYNDSTNKIWLRFRLKIEERRLLKHCEKVIYVSPLTLNIQKKTFKEYSNKMYFVAPPVIINKVLNNSNQIKYEIGYFGSYNTRARNIMPFYNCLINSNKKTIIVGTGDIKLKNTSNIKIIERISLNDTNIMQNKVKILVCICNTSGTQIPSKLYNYSTTNKKILVILDGENSNLIKEYLNKYQRFYFAYNTEQSIKKSINELLCLEAPYLFTPIFNFTPKNIAADILDTKFYN